MNLPNSTTLEQIRVSDGPIRAASGIMARRQYGSGGSGRRYADTSEVCGGANLQGHHEHIQINMYIHNLYVYMSIEMKKLQHKIRGKR